MRKIILLLLTVLTLTRILGQENKIILGVEGSPGLIFLYGNDILKTFYKPTLGFSSGLFCQYNFPQYYSIRTNIAYERKGSELNHIITYTDQNGVEIGSERIVGHINFDYLTMPILFRMTIGKKIKYFFNAGPYVGYLISQISVWEKSMYVPAKTENNTENFKRFDTGVTTGLGLSISIIDKLMVSLEIRNSTGLLNVSDLPIGNNGSIKTNSTNLLIGLTYKLRTRT